MNLCRVYFIENLNFYRNDLEIQLFDKNDILITFFDMLYILFL